MSLQGSPEVDPGTGLGALSTEGCGALSLRVNDISAVRLYIPFEALAV